MDTYMTITSQDSSSTRGPVPYRYEYTCTGTHASTTPVVHMCDTYMTDLMDEHQTVPAPVTHGEVFTSASRCTLSLLRHVFSRPLRVHSPKLTDCGMTTCDRWTNK